MTTTPSIKNTVWQHHWFGLFCLATFTLFLALGTWQTKRMIWKNTLLQELSVKNSLPPTPFPLTPSDSFSLEEWRYRPTTFFGTAHHGKELHWAGQYYHRELGYQVITPVTLNTGLTVLVARGWVPADRKESSSRIESIADSTLTGEGFVMPGRGKPFSFMPDSTPEQNIWLWPDIKEMAAWLNQTQDMHVSPILIQQTGEPTENELPVVLRRDIQVYDNHLTYMLTWFSLALVTVIMYSLYILRKVRHA